MKVCLLISGLPRNIDRGYPEILNNLMAPNEPDVFIHTWVDTDTDHVLPQKIVELFKPKKILMEKQRIFTNTSWKLDRMLAYYARFYTKERFTEMLYSSWYSIQQCNLLKEQYRLENNIQYDYVIRARFDISYNHIVDCKQYDNTAIHISNRLNLPTEMIDDRFAFGPNGLMNAYCGSFNFLDYVHDLKDPKDGIFCGETLVFEMVKMLNIPYKQIDSLCCDFIR